FAAASERLHQLADEWSRALAGGDGAAAFLAPDAARLRELGAAATDEDAAGRALADGFSLETLEALTLLRSPMIAAKEREAKAALEGFDQAEQIDVVLRRYASLVAAGMGNGAAAGMARPPEFPFPGVLALKGRIVAETVRAAREELEAARRDALTMARKSYWELRYVVGAIEATSRTIDLLENLSASVSARYEAGETSFQDVVRARIEREKALEELKTLAGERRNMEADLRGILALSPRVAVGTPAPREMAATLPDQQAVERLALERRQEVRAADAMVHRMELMLEMVETMTYPGFDLGLTPAAGGLALPAAAPGSGADAGAMGAERARVEPPQRPFFAADESYLRELRQRVAMQRSERDAARAATLVGVRAAWFGLDRARRTAVLYGERVLPLSQSAIDASLRGYTAGRVAFSDLLESFTGWLEGNLALERARADAGSARAVLEAAAGTAGIEETP
ncbi:MAG TPA: TolC family protein, partial [bacterium]